MSCAIRRIVIAKTPQTQFLAGEAVFEAGVGFAQEEWFVPAPGSAHAIQRAIEEAIRAREERQQKTVPFNLSGRELLNLSAYQQCLSGEMQDHVATDGEIAGSLANLPAVDCQESAAQS